MESRRDHRSPIVASAVAALLVLGGPSAWAENDPPPYDTPSTTIVYTTPDSAVVEAETRGGSGDDKPATAIHRKKSNCYLEAVETAGEIDGVGHVSLPTPTDESAFWVVCDGETIGMVWLPIDPDPVAPRPVSPRSVAESLREEIPMPAVDIKINPDVGLVGSESWFWIEGYSGEPITNSTDAFGNIVEVEARPTSYEWSFGDGTVISTEAPGNAYPARSEIRHMFERASEDGYQVMVRFTFDVRYRTAGGSWTELPGISRTASATYRVQESQAVIQR
jgi:hypothetical protein